MINIICKLLRRDANSREGIITSVSVLGIAVNIIIAAVKIIIGATASSIAIITEGVNNATDSLTSVLTLVGTKLAGKHPDKKHPFGYGRIEYLTSLVISTLIIVTGVELLISSVKLIFSPAKLDISYLALVIIAVSALIKLWLGIFTVKMGKKAESPSLVAIGVESKNDSFVSVVTIISAAVFLIFHFSIDAYAGVITSAVILKSGAVLLIDTVSELIGRPGKEELASKLYEEIRATDGIINAADMMLHNYGPDAYSGSVNVEIDHDKTVGEIYDFLHELQLRIFKEHNVTMVFGIYAVDNDHEEIREIRKAVGDFVKSYEHVKSYHAIYLDPSSDKLYCDLVVDYDLKNWDSLREEFLSYMSKHFPDNEIILTVETEYV